MVVNVAYNTEKIIYKVDITGVTVSTERYHLVYKFHKKLVIIAPYKMPNCKTD